MIDRIDRHYLRSFSARNATFVVATALATVVGPTTRGADMAAQTLIPQAAQKQASSPTEKIAAQLIRQNRMSGSRRNVKKTCG